MPTAVELTLACGDYEITRPLKEGTVRPDGIDLRVVTAMDSPTRHWRFLRNREFDMAEVSCSSYIAARDNGLAFRAIPVFPHRRFRHGFAFVNTEKGIKKPADLVGKADYSIAHALSVRRAYQLALIDTSKESGRADASLEEASV